MRLSGGRTWWAHFEFTRINIEPTILRKKIEDLHQLAAFRIPAVAKCKLTPSRRVDRHYAVS